MPRAERPLESDGTALTEFAATCAEFERIAGAELARVGYPVSGPR